MLLFSFCFGDAKRNKVTKKEKRRLRSALTENQSVVLIKKETGCAFYGVRGRCAPPPNPLAKRQCRYSVDIVAVPLTNVSINLFPPLNYNLPTILTHTFSKIS